MPGPQPQQQQQQQQQAPPSAPPQSQPQPQQQQQQQSPYFQQQQAPLQQLQQLLQQQQQQQPPQSHPTASASSSSTPPPPQPYSSAAYSSYPPGVQPSFYPGTKPGAKKSQPSSSPPPPGPTPSSSSSSNSVVPPPPSHTQPQPQPQPPSSAPPKAPSSQPPPWAQPPQQVMFHPAQLQLPPTLDLSEIQYPSSPSVEARMREDDEKSQKEEKLRTAAGFPDLVFTLACEVTAPPPQPQLWQPGLPLPGPSTHCGLKAEICLAKGCKEKNCAPLYPSNPSHPHGLSPYHLTMSHDERLCSSHQKAASSAASETSASEKKSVFAVDGVLSADFLEKKCIAKGCFCEVRSHMSQYPSPSSAYSPYANVQGSFCGGNRCTCTQQREQHEIQKSLMPPDGSGIMYPYGGAYPGMGGKIPIPKCVTQRTLLGTRDTIWRQVSSVVLRIAAFGNSKISRLLRSTWFILVTTQKQLCLLVFPLRRASNRYLASLDSRVGKEFVGLQQQEGEPEEEPEEDNNNNNMTKKNKEEQKSKQQQQVQEGEEEEEEEEANKEGGGEPLSAEELQERSRFFELLVGEKGGAMTFPDLGSRGGKMITLRPGLPTGNQSEFMRLKMEHEMNDLRESVKSQQDQIQELKEIVKELCGKK